MSATATRIAARLKAELGDSLVLAGEADRWLYATDASRLRGACAAVVRPREEEQVLRLVRLAREADFRLVPRGAGTSPTGSARPAGDDVVVDLSAMNRILDVDPVDLVAEVEPGVTCGALQAEAEARGLFYPPDPASSRYATLGGNVATDAGGLRAVKYGVTRDYVLGLRAVTGSGELLVTGGRNLKDVTGYDLTRLLVGSEGTLAIFTRLVLRLVPRPAATRTLLASFDDEEGGLRGADHVLGAGVLPRALEYLDRDVLEIVSHAHDRALAPRCRSQLLVEVDGARSQVAEDAAAVEAALVEAGAHAVEPASTPAERDRLWALRRSVSSAVFRITPAKRSEDVGVPRSRLAEAIRRIKAAGRERRIRVLAYGHAGDANLHCNFLYDPAEAGATERLEAAVSAAWDVVLECGGTLTGEHGIGTKKVDVLARAAGPVAHGLMRGIKRLFDPDGRLNPGKVISGGDER